MVVKIPFAVVCKALVAAPVGRAELSTSTSPISTPELADNLPIAFVPAGKDATTSTCNSVPLTAPAKRLVSASIVVNKLFPEVCNALVAAPEGRAEVEISICNSPSESVLRT